MAASRAPAGKSESDEEDQTWLWRHCYLLGNSVHMTGNQTDTQHAFQYDFKVHVPHLVTVLGTQYHTYALYDTY